MEWKQLLTSITGTVDEELRLRNAYLAAENRIFRHQITGRVQFTDAERKILAAMGQKLGKQALEEIATIAQADTILGWHRQLVVQKGDGSPQQKAPGRPRVDKELEALVVRMAQENRSWGYDRIVGALANLGYAISDQTVGNILKRHGIPPAPERKTTTTWREFIGIHIDVLRATDFFRSAVWTWLGLVLSSMLLFLHISCRTIHVAGMAAWLNARWRLPIPPRSYWRASVERWIYAVMEQGLSQLLQCGGHVRRPVLSEVATHAQQGHFLQGRGTVVLLPVVNRRPVRDGPLRRRQRLSGLLMDANREAA